MILFLRRSWFSWGQETFKISPYEPWSAAITGTRGTAPDYDVLQFMIDEAHARDIEFQA